MKSQIKKFAASHETKTTKETSNNAPNVHEVFNCLQCQLLKTARELLRATSTNRWQRGNQYLSHPERSIAVRITVREALQATAKGQKATLSFSLNVFDLVFHPSTGTPWFSTTQFITKLVQCVPSHPPTLDARRKGRGSQKVLNTSYETPSRSNLLIQNCLGFGQKLHLRLKPGTALVDISPKPFALPSRPCFPRANVQVTHQPHID